MVPSRTGILLGALLAVACTDARLHVIGLGPDTSPLGEGGGPPNRGAAFGPGTHLAAYWGQDLYGRAVEKSLADTCVTGPYDVVVIAYVTEIASGTDGTPAAFRDNLSSHCVNAVSLPGSGISRCDEMAQGIQACHDAKKKVLLSIGQGDPGLSGDLDGGVGVQAARSMWNMFLGGDAAARPFGAAPLDGVDLDYAAAKSPGFSAFVAELRAIMTRSGGTYYITAAPQCPFPDDHLGPRGGPIGDHPWAFDALFVKFFYNQGVCEYGTPDGGFERALNGWAGFAREGSPQIFVGLPASPSIMNLASAFVDRSNLPALISTAQASGVFGGIMLLDVSFDQNSADDAGTTYGQAVKAALP